MRFVLGRLVVVAVAWLPHRVALAVCDLTKDVVWGKYELCPDYQPTAE